MKKICLVMAVSFTLISSSCFAELISLFSTKNRAGYPLWLLFDSKGEVGLYCFDLQGKIADAALGIYAGNPTKSGETVLLFLEDDPMEIGVIEGSKLTLKKSGLVLYRDTMTNLNKDWRVRK